MSFLSQAAIFVEQLLSLGCQPPLGHSQQFLLMSKLEVLRSQDTLTGLKLFQEPHAASIGHLCLLYLPLSLMSSDGHLFQLHAEVAGLRAQQLLLMQCYVQTSLPLLLLLLCQALLELQGLVALGQCVSHLY